MTKLRARRRPAGTSGFTLIELLAVIVIIGILMTFLLPKIPEMIDNAKVLACKKNQEEIYKGIVSYHAKYGRLPSEGGVKFFGCLVSRGVWANNPTSVKKLSCPGVEVTALTPGAEDLEYDQWFADLDAVDGGYSAYAGRDIKGYPLRRFPGRGNEPLVGDDNDGGRNHDTTTNVLYDDGAVRPFEFHVMLDKGQAHEEDGFVIVGPESPVEDLQKLSLD